MANQFYSSKNGVNWGNIADSAIGAGVGTLVSGGLGALLGAGGSFITGAVSNHFNKKSEKRAMEDLAARMEMEYQYAQRYAENSPSWTVKGLRQAGINPMLPFTSGVPSSPSVSSTGISPSHTDTRSESRFDPLLLANIGVAQAQREMYIKQGNAAETTAKATAMNAETNRTNSGFDNMLKEAEVALKTLEKERYESGGNHDIPQIREARRTLGAVFDTFNHGWDYFKDSFAPSSSRFIDNTPKLQSTQYSKDLDRFLDSMMGNPYTGKHGIFPIRGLRRFIDKLGRKSPLFFKR